MEFLDNILSFIEHSDEQKLSQVFAGVIISTVLMVGGIMYFGYNGRAEKVKTLEGIHDQRRKISAMLDRYDKIKAEEDRIQELLENNKNFNIKSYFEQFCAQHNITPDAGWDTDPPRAIDGNDKFDEILLPASFRGETMQRLTTILNDLDKNEIIYIKELDITREEGAKLSFRITIATKKKRTNWED